MPQLATLFAELQAERERSWAPEQLQANAAQRAELVARYDPRHHVQIGERVGPFTLITPQGETLSREALLAEGPVALVFFRFAGCPACNIALPHYDRALRPGLEARGIRLIAVSPQIPEWVGEIRDRHGLGFPVVSDPDNQLGKALGITFEPREQPAVAPGASWIGAVTGTNSWTLPQPAIVVIDADTTVRFVDVSPDWMARTEAEPVLAALESVRAAA